MNKRFSVVFPTPVRLWLPAFFVTWALGMSFARSELFVTLSGGSRVSAYHSLTGATLDLDFVSGISGASGVTSSGNTLYVSLGSVIEQFSSVTGSALAITAISGLNFGHQTAVSGTDLYVANFGGTTIGKYTTSGATVNASLITGLSGPSFLAVSGSDLYVGNFSG